MTHRPLAAYTSLRRWVELAKSSDPLFSGQLDSVFVAGLPASAGDSLTSTGLTSDMIAAVRLLA